MRGKGDVRAKNLRKEVGIEDEGEGESFGYEKVLWECLWERRRKNNMVFDRKV